MTSDKGDVVVDAQAEKKSEDSTNNKTEITPATNGKEIPETIASEENGVSELEGEIIRQIEYYFGDMNLPRDKFLKEQIELDEGWVPFTTMFNFKRLSNLTQDFEVVIAALAKSESQLMEISEDKKKIRRSPNYPLPELNEERRKELMKRTVYCKGFPKDKTTIDDCLNFFKKYSIPDNIVLRRYQDKATKQWEFKGSIFVTFKTVEAAESFLSEKSVKYGETELIKKWQSVYVEEKRAEIEERQKKISSKKEKQQKKQEEQKTKITLPTGTVLLLSGLSEAINRDSIKDAVTSLGGNVAFVKIEDGKAWIRLNTENTAKDVFEKCTEGKIKIEEAELECAVLEGEEEQKFLDEMANEMTKRRQKQYKNKSGGKQHYNRKRKNASNDGPPSKRK